MRTTCYHVLLAFERGGGEIRATATGVADRVFNAPSSAGEHRFLAASSRGESQLTVTGDGTLTIQVLKNAEEVVIPGRAIHHSQPTWNYSLPPVAWSPVAPTLAFGTPNATGGPNVSPGLWNLGRGELVSASEKGNHYTVVSLAWSADGKQLASASYDGTVIVWDVEQKTVARTLSKFDEEKPLGEVHSLDWSPDGRYIAAGMDSWILVWDAESGEIVHRLKSWGWIYNLCFSHDSSRLASGDSGGQGLIWDMKTGEAIHRLNHHSNVWGVTWSSDDASLACSSNDHVYVWKTRSGAE